MNLYIDTSALIKRHIEENFSEHVREWVENSNVVATALITRAESAAAINRLLRMKIINQVEYKTALNDFRSSWDYYHRLFLTEEIVARADLLTCQFQLRGYDSVHLACALTWQDLIGEPVAIASFDAELCDAAQNAGLEVLFV
jgi:predicted nucleic acid-binding protein